MTTEIWPFIPDVTRAGLAFLALDGHWFAYVRRGNHVYAGAGATLPAAVADALAGAFPQLVPAPPEPIA